MEAVGLIPFITVMLPAKNPIQTFAYTGRYPSLVMMRFDFLPVKYVAGL